MERAAAMYCSGCSSCCRSWWWLSLWRPRGGHNEAPGQQRAAAAQARQPHKPKPSSSSSTPASSPPLLLLLRKPLPLPLPRPRSHHGRIRHRRRRTHLARASAGLACLPSRAEATVAFPSPPLAAPHRVMNPRSSWSVSVGRLDSQLHPTVPRTLRCCLSVCGSIVGVYVSSRMKSCNWDSARGVGCVQAGVSTVMLDTLVHTCVCFALPLSSLARRRWIDPTSPRSNRTTHQADK